MRLLLLLLLNVCVVLLVAARPSLAYTGCNATPMSIQIEPCGGCKPANVTAAWPGGSGEPTHTMSGWLPISFKYNEVQYAVTLQAVDSNGNEQTLKLSTVRLAVVDSGRFDGALVVGDGVNEFFHWPISVLNAINPGGIYDETCWYMGTQ